MSAKRHPLPRSDEARHSEIPEHLEQEKGCGDDARAAVQPAGEPVAPDGEPYRSADPGRAPVAEDGADELAQDQAAHQDRGQGVAEQEAGRG